MGIKYYMEGFIKYLIINTVGNLKRGFKCKWEKSHITVGQHDRE